VSKGAHVSCQDARRKLASWAPEAPSSSKSKPPAAALGRLWRSICRCDRRLATVEGPRTGPNVAMGFGLMERRMEAFSKGPVHADEA